MIKITQPTSLENESNPRAPHLYNKGLVDVLCVMFFGGWGLKNLFWARLMLLGLGYFLITIQETSNSDRIPLYLSSGSSGLVFFHIIFRNQ